MLSPIHGCFCVSVNPRGIPREGSVPRAGDPRARRDARAVLFHRPGHPRLRAGRVLAGDADPRPGAGPAVREGTMVFTWGPWGFLCSRYHLGALEAVPILVWQTVGQFLAAFALLHLVRALPRWRRLAFVACLLAFHWEFQDVEYFALIILTGHLRSHGQGRIAGPPRRVDAIPGIPVAFQVHVPGHIVGRGPRGDGLLGGQGLMGARGGDRGRLLLLTRRGMDRRGPASGKPARLPVLKPPDGRGLRGRHGTG